MERVKRLAGNEIELGIKIPPIESRASNIPMDKENNVCCHNGLTDKVLEICPRGNNKMVIIIFPCS